GGLRHPGRSIFGRRIASRSDGARRPRVSAARVRAARSGATGIARARGGVAAARRAGAARRSNGRRTGPAAHNERRRRPRSDRRNSELLPDGRGACASARTRPRCAAASREGHGHPLTHVMTAARRWIRMAALALVACGAFAATHVAAADKVHVEFWTMSLKPTFTPYFRALVTQYTASHPNVELEWVDVPWDTLQTKLTAAIVAGSAPALVQLNVPWAYDYALYGALRPIDDLLGDDREHYTEGSIADLTFKGNVYGFPHYNSVNVMAYNRTLFKEAGITRIPATRDEQLDAAKKIKARSGQYGFSPALGKIAGVFLEEGLPLVEN